MNNPSSGACEVELHPSDAVILDLTPGTPSPVLASFKAQTTSDVTLGIQEAIKGCLSKTDVNKSQIQAVSIGTTSFVNSLVERDSTKLQRVAIIRLCGPYSRLTPPFASFPYELRHVLEGPVFFAEGGLQVDGREISTVGERFTTSILRWLRWSRTRYVGSVRRSRDRTYTLLLCLPYIHLSITPSNKRNSSGLSSSPNYQMSESPSARRLRTSVC